MSAENELVVARIGGKISVATRRCGDTHKRAQGEIMFVVKTGYASVEEAFADAEAMSIPSSDAYIYAYTEYGLNRSSVYDECPRGMLRRSVQRGHGWTWSRPT